MHSISHLAIFHVLHIFAVWSLGLLIIQTET
jgi:hypothetical protein